ncbi:leucyl aminopeptidase [Pseudalkalibacillus berkeleyi]|uniref:Probable cytosol aminopeptidase n=1 Tax=Pseudalkalibacillus berkeleyi TaxID=1069813 RepID=A0ABS9H3Z4_9BACL|nr:leucyl aminopeptidase [Pseudalkalibacillus berkeleyi]MCF6138518.1 leucyl aminopeptidase [Pseudalkalibacillus berkeleyi]
MFTVKKSLNLKQDIHTLVVGIYADDKKPVGIVEEIDRALNGHITELFKTDDLSAKHKKVSRIHTLGALGVKNIYFVGLGQRKNTTFRNVRDALGKTAKELKQHNQADVVIALDSFLTEEVGLQQTVHALSEAFILATYQFEDYKEKKNDKRYVLKSINIYSEQESSIVNEALKKGEAYAAGTNVARDLVNTPGNMLTPTDLAEQAVGIAKKYGFEYDVLEESDMKELGMGALLGVSAGSEQDAKLIVVKYKAKADWDNVLTFVGKGLTFDAGGYSLKPALNMHEMKSDMGGSAAVLGAMESIGRLKPDVNIMFVIPSSENLINGSAMKPGDVLTSMSGKTIEITNTDAEGRLILADAITYAKEQGASHLVDLATLTGGVVVAFGDIASGVMSNDEAFFDMFEQSAEEAGEYVWRLPMFGPYKKILRTSNVADFVNSAGRNAHPIQGGVFLSEFVGDTPWLHLDIAGTAYSNKASDLGPKGATGVLTRSIVKLVEKFETK